MFRNVQMTQNARKLGAYLPTPEGELHAVSVTWGGHHLDALYGRAMVMIPDQAIGIVEGVLVALAAIEIG
jgi:hypothetical protein